MTFHSLYRLEQRGLLDCPIVGVAVDDWSDKDLREHARKAIETSSGAKPDPKVFNRLAKRPPTCRATSRTTRPTTASPRRSGRPALPTEIPPSLFGMTIKGLPAART